MFRIPFFLQRRKQSGSIGYEIIFTLEKGKVAGMEEAENGLKCLFLFYNENGRIYLK